MSYRLSRRAEEDLIEIYVASVQAFGVTQAERYQDALEAAFDLIAEFPQIARERSEFDPRVRIHPCKSHVVVYLIASDGPFIVRVRHGHEDWESSPSGH
ncbi:MAG: type II toxin-antitoxin system RelE/ParE family toxin [Pseudomonadota bacterium]|uniref:type II toxin-antitoxin system RelE/ParE family toxin n=1 Tax=Phenylobacterium sp. TaxID=1871053 RepID=UPI0025E8D429|nr:type II toxin-antitoxin system RelE/ParE family toxin [Phenylobacterium sp.]MBT9469791.1 type II toxin-antitoxin system RelE/ParE family toxin [Phenylobacterium sp.]